jgi:prepilin-type N-terminal cleavage/methylation domain-containing protein/prepilin-type processing-associated H-X9-DG protein
MECSHGFTLMEVLVAVGVLLVLGALTLPALARMRAVRDNVVCVSNLRQIGFGTLSFIQDNGGGLPGPLQASQYPYWNWPTQLSQVLADYLLLDKTRTKVFHDDVFVCPAFKRAVKVLGNAPVLTLNIRVSMDGNPQPLPPFGYPSGDFPSTFGTSKVFKPLHSLDLARIVDEDNKPAQSSTWMLMDVDQLSPQFTQGTDGASARHKLPANRVHGNHRNALFFDFHVGRVD